MARTFTKQESERIANVIAENMKCGFAEELIDNAFEKFNKMWGNEGHAKENAQIAAVASVMFAFAANHWDAILEKANI